MNIMPWVIHVAGITVWIKTFHGIYGVIITPLLRHMPYDLHRNNLNSHLSHPMSSPTKMFDIFSTIHPTNTKNWVSIKMVNIFLWLKTNVHLNYQTTSSPKSIHLSKVDLCYFVLQSITITGVIYLSFSCGNAVSYPFISITCRWVY